MTRSPGWRKPWNPVSPPRRRGACSNDDGDGPGYDLGQPATEADQLRYRAALERLPKGSTATPRVVFVSPYDQKTDPHWRVTFTVGPMRYESARRFGSVAEAETYATEFLARLRGQINRP